MTPNLDNTEATTNRRRIPVFLSLLIYITCFFLVLVSLQSIVYLLVPNSNEESLELMFLSQVAMLATVLIVTAIVWLLIDRLPLSLLGLPVRGRGKDILCGMLVAIAIYAVGFGICCATGLVVIDSISFNISALCYSFIFFILVSLSEEIMCRGYLLGRMLQSKTNRYVALLISSLIFALLHVFNPNITVLSFVNIWLAGCMLGVTYLYTRNLWFPISLHLFWNWIQGPVLGYEVSGMSLFPTMLHTSMPVKNSWNGGMFGFEGSLICTILMLIFTISVIVYFERKKQKENPQTALQS